MIASVLDELNSDGSGGGFAPGGCAGCPGCVNCDRG